MVKQELTGQKYDYFFPESHCTVCISDFQLQPADKVVEMMLKHMTQDDSGYQYFKVEPGTV